MGGVIIIIIIFLFINVVLVSILLTNKKGLDICLNTESPFCLSVSCNQSNETTVSEGEKQCGNYPYRKIPGTGDIECKHPPSLLPVKTKKK